MQPHKQLFSQQARVDQVQVGQLSARFPFNEGRGANNLIMIAV